MKRIGTSRWASACCTTSVVTVVRRSSVDWASRVAHDPVAFKSLRLAAIDPPFVPVMDRPQDTAPQTPESVVAYHCRGCDERLFFEDDRCVDAEDGYVSFDRPAVEEALTIAASSSSNDDHFRQEAPPIAPVQQKQEGRHALRDRLLLAATGVRPTSTTTPSGVGVLQPSIVRSPHAQPYITKRQQWVESKSHRMVRARMAGGKNLTDERKALGFITRGELHQVKQARLGLYRPLDKPVAEGLLRYARCRRCEGFVARVVPSPTSDTGHRFVCNSNSLLRYRGV